MAESIRIPLIKDGTNIIPESNSLMMYNSIVRIEYKLNKGEEVGTGFFMKIPHENTHEYFNFLVTNCHAIPESFVEEKKEIDIFFGNSKMERKRKIDLDRNKRYIKCNKNCDYTVIQILNKDKIFKGKYLYPEPNYKKGCEFYLNQPCYLAGYPVINKDKEGYPKKKPERCISPGKITQINKVYKYDFEHYLETKNGSSGSPICLQCLQDNKFFIVGIHKQYNNRKNINCGTFIGVIIDEINKEDEIQKIISIKEKDDEDFANEEKELENSEQNDEKNLEEKLIKEEKDEHEKRRFILKYIFEENEYGKHYFLTFLIFLILLTNLKLILTIENNNFILPEINIFIYICKAIGILLALITNHYFLIFLIIVQVLSSIIFLSNFYQNQELYIEILFITRNFIKDALLIKIRKYNFYESMIFYNIAEGFSNYLSYLIILILKYVFHPNNFEFSIIIIVSSLNLLNYIIFFIYSKNLKKFYKKNLNNNKKNEKENEANENIGCFKKIFEVIFKIILNFFLNDLINYSSLEPSRLYKEGNYFKLYWFIHFDFIGRTLSKDNVDSIPAVSLCSFIILLIPFLYYYLFEKNYLALIIFSLFYGNTCLIINYIKNKDNLAYYLIMQLLFSI